MSPRARNSQKLLIVTCSCPQWLSEMLQQRCSCVGVNRQQYRLAVPSRQSVSCRVVASSADLSSSCTVTYINRHVRGDEHVEALGSVVVRGDVDTDASIEAVGDVMVWGRLSGHVHAGCAGDRSAVISALELRGASLVIARSTSLGAARITVPGPHTASVVQVGRGLSINLSPLGPSHPPLNSIGLTSSFKRFLAWYPAAAAALLTGCYALIAGLALLVAPKTVLGLLFEGHAVPSTWIRVGGVLFATFGAQYFGTAIADYRQVHAASTSSSGCPDMPFRPASPQPTGGLASTAAAAAAGKAAQQQQQQQQQPGTDPLQQQRAAATPAAAAFASATAGALLHDSSVLVDSGRWFSSSSNSGSGSSGSTSSSSSSSRPDVSASQGSRPVTRSVAAGQLTSEQIQQLRQSHKQWHKAAAAAAAGSGFSESSSSSSSSGSNVSSVSSSGDGSFLQHSYQGNLASMSSMQSQWDHPQLHALQQQQQQQQYQPPTWAFCSAGFYEASVWSRLGLAAAFCALVAIAQAPAGLLVLALINLLGALSMWGALRRQWLMHVMGDMPEAAGAYASGS